MQASRARRGLLVLVAGMFSLSQNGDEPDECVNPIIQTCWSTSLQAGSASLLATSPRWCRWLPRRASRVRASSWALAPSSPRHTVAPEDAPLRAVCQNSASDAPDAFAAAALAALINVARGVPRVNGIRNSM